MLGNIKKQSGFLSLFGTAIIYGVSGIFIRDLGLMFGNFSQVAIRMFFAACIALFFVVLFKINLKIDRKLWAMLLLFAIVYPLSSLFFTLSISLEKIANTVFMFYAGAILSSFFLGTYVLKEKSTFPRILSILLVLLGLYVFTFPLSDFKLSLGLILGLSSGIFEGLSNLSRKKLEGVPKNTLLVYQYFFGFFLTGALVFLTGEQAYLGFSSSGFIALIFQVAALFSVGHLLTYGFQNYDVNIGSVIVTSGILFAIVFGFIFANEIPTQTELLGGIIIFLAACVSNLDIRLNHNFFNIRYYLRKPNYKYKKVNRNPYGMGKRR